MEAYIELEQEFGAWAKADNVVACSSGTAALHLAMEALRLPKGSSVIMSDFNMVACARAAALAGLKPVFVDCNERLLLDPSKLTNAHCKAASAILATHVYGRRCDMDTLARIACDYDLYMLEDSAEAHGVVPHPATDATCWSFYRNKIIAGEEGGAIAFAHSSAAKLAKQLRSLGFTDAHDYTHFPYGHNYRMSNLHASAILASLRGANANIAERRRIVDLYESHCPAHLRMPRRDALWVYDVRLPQQNSYEALNRVVAQLKAAGIAARHGFKPMTMQMEFIGEVNLEAMQASLEVLYLPIVPWKTYDRETRTAFDVIQIALGV